MDLEGGGNPPWLYGEREGVLDADNVQRTVEGLWQRIQLLDATLDAAEASITALQALTATTAWTALPLDADYANFGGGNQAAQYRKVGDQVFLRGLITRPVGLPVNAEILATLPAGFRPPATVRFICVCSGTDAICVVNVASSGNVTVNLAGAAMVETDFIDLSAVRFAV